MKYYTVYKWSFGHWYDICQWRFSLKWKKRWHRDIESILIGFLEVRRYDRTYTGKWRG